MCLQVREVQGVGDPSAGVWIVLTRDPRSDGCYWVERDCRRRGASVSEAESRIAYSFTAGPDIKRTIAPKSLERFKQRIRDITKGPRATA